MRPGDVDSAKRERAIAGRLLAHEAESDLSAPGLVVAANRVFDRLYYRLSLVIGTDGFDSLARRALYLAALEYPYLASVTTRAEPEAFRLVGLDTSMSERPPGEVQDGVVAILGYFFWLFVTMVGQTLFNRLMRRVFPEVSLEDTGRGSEGNQE